MKPDEHVKNNLKDAIRDVPDFPKKGNNFKDITTVLQDGKKFRQCVDLLTKRYKDREIDTVVCVESRGFIFGAALAYNRIKYI